MEQGKYNKRSSNRSRTVLDVAISKAYNPRHSEGVSAADSDREGCIWWKHPQKDSAEVV